MTDRRPRWRNALVPISLAAVLLTGCGTADSTADVSPLSARLAQIDQSLAAKRFEQARRDLAALAAATKASRDAGELSTSRADTILDAIVALRTTLPAPATSATPKPTPTQTPTQVPTQTTRPTTGTTGTSGTSGTGSVAKPSGGKGKGKGGGKGR